MSRILASTLAFGLLLSASTPAHAGWLMAKAQKAARRLLQKTQQSSNAPRDEREQRRQEEERDARRQRVIKQVVKTSSNPVRQSIQPGLGGGHGPITLAERLGGSRGDQNRVSSLHQMLVRNGRSSGESPIFGFRTNFHPVFRNSSTNGAGTSLFNFSL